MRLPSLDPNGINSLLILIERIAKNHGLTFIISSHILSNLEQVCTKNYLLKNHKLICLDDDANAKYKIYTEDLSMKSLMTLLKLNDLAFERQKNDILVKGIEKIKQVLGQGGILSTYEKVGFSRYFFMATRLKTVFLKQECVTKSAFICLVLLGLIGAIVILCDGYKGSYLGLSAILASYSIMVWWILSLLT